MKKTIVAAAFAACSAAAAASEYSPEAWFHFIGGNASKEGIVADLDAIKEAGIGGVHFFHGGWKGGTLWPGVKESMPCLSEKWEDLVAFLAGECAKRGIAFKMQNCPGWSMSGGPWVPVERAMRKLVCFEPGKEPKWDKDDDYREIGAVTFPVGETLVEQVCSVTFPNPQQICHHWAYEPDAELLIYEDGKEVFRRRCPQGAWQDSAGMTFVLPRRLNPVMHKLRAEVHSRHCDAREVKVVFGRQTGILDDWESKAALGLREFRMTRDDTPVNFDLKKTLVFGHVNAKRVNGPAPGEATGWECDKMDRRGCEANWSGYIGKLAAGPLKGGMLKGVTVDSWECSVQSWTWKMESEFKRLNGYELREWLPALFGYILVSPAATERFLLDWRRTCSRLIEDNYYGAMADIAHRNGMTIQFETAFGDVINGDILRYWKYADEPMCEFWSPFRNDEGFVGSHDFKPIRPCVSAAHIYGKKRVTAESFTSFKLTFNESMQELKENANRHFARGLTHIVFHTFTHNPVVGGKPPGSSFGNAIGTPFLRLQPWWKYMPCFTAYLERCGRQLERGKPVVDILRYLGDDFNHKPGERGDLFENRYKYDYLNNDALMTRADVRGGRIVFPDGMSYRVLWLPSGTFLLPETKARLDELEKKGARIIRGPFKPDWPSPLESIGRTGKDLWWYQRRDGDEDVFFISELDGRSQFLVGRGGAWTSLDPVSGETKPCDPKSRVRAKPPRVTALAAKPREDYPIGATERIYDIEFDLDEVSPATLDLGRVCHWATVKVNGTVAAKLWCKPFGCDVTRLLRRGRNVVEVSVTSTIYNQLVVDAGKPEADRATWTICGPGADAPFAEAGLVGPVTLCMPR
ncbi:MAG: hypothetical protein J6T01_05640 [Kiritimatiellae bacterium]|nr:hypothetical protein [Kiritimatiellia bacterium]